MSVAHIPLVADHLEEAPYVGVGFVLLSIAGILLAHLLMSSDDIEVWVAAAVVATLALVAYGLSRSVGLPQIHDEIGNWSDRLGMVAVASEALMLGFAAARLRTAAAAPRTAASREVDRVDG
jgi:hypothetical protein